MIAIAATALLLQTAVPLRFVSGAEKVTFRENGQVQSYFRVIPGRPLRMQTSGTMLLLVPARAIVSPTGKAAAEVVVVVSGEGRPAAVFRETLGDAAPFVSLSDGAAAAGAKVLRVQIE